MIALTLCRPSMKRAVQNCVSMIERRYQIEVLYTVNSALSGSSIAVLSSKYRSKTVAYQYYLSGLSTSIRCTFHLSLAQMIHLQKHATVYRQSIYFLNEVSAMTIIV